MLGGSQLCLVRLSCKRHISCFSLEPRPPKSFSLLNLPQRLRVSDFSLHPHPPIRAYEIGDLLTLLSKLSLTNKFDENEYWYRVWGLINNPFLVFGQIVQVWARRAACIQRPCPSMRTIHTKATMDTAQLTIPTNTLCTALRFMH